jgi:hypothetical protein
MIVLALVLVFFLTTWQHQYRKLWIPVFVSIVMGNLTKVSEDNKDICVKTSLSDWILLIGRDI